MSRRTLWGEGLLALPLALSLSLSLPVCAQEAVTRWLDVRAANPQVELSVFDLEMSPVAGEAQRVAVTLATAWRNVAPPQRMSEIEWKTTGVGGLGSFGRARPPTGRAAEQHTAYLVPRVGDHIYLVHGIGGVARLGAASAGDEDGEDDEDAAGREIRLPRQHDEVELALRFEIERADADTLTLVFFDFDNGHITVPLTERQPPREGAAPLAEAANDYLRARVYGSTMHGGALEVALGLVSTYEGSVVDVELGDAIRLRLADGDELEPVFVAPAAWGDASVRILPEWEQRCRLRFEGASPGMPAELRIALPGAAVLALPLRTPGSAGGVAERRQGGQR